MLALASIRGPTHSVVLQLEIEKVQKRREERELEKVRAEEEALMLNRERAVAEGFELDKKEELVRSCSIAARNPLAVSVIGSAHLNISTL